MIFCLKYSMINTIDSNDSWKVRIFESDSWVPSSTMRTGLSIFVLLLQVGCLQVQSETIGEKIFKKIVKTCGVPTIKNVMRNLTLEPGDRARFHCKVDMKCMVSYIHWYHEMTNGSVRLLRTGASAGNPYSYHINKVIPSDSGFYSCVAGNILGESVSSAYLEINSSLSLKSSSLILTIMLILHITHNIRTHELRTFLWHQVDV